VRGKALLTLAALASATGCDDGFGPFDWNSTPDTVAVYSLARDELLGLPSALDFARGRVQLIRVDLPGASGLWDVALREVDGEFVLLPAGVVGGIGIRPGIAVVEDQAFEDVLRAPRDTAAYTRAEPVQVRTDAVYVIRSGRRAGTSCIYFAKAEVVAVDADEGRVDIRVVQNPYCNDRFLIPPSER